MEGLFFNVDNGYLEGILRGYRSGLLNATQYVNLTQCETLEGKYTTIIIIKYQLDLC
jgi:V-type H+-transporting ATPase subunit d